MCPSAGFASGGLDQLEKSRREKFSAHEILPPVRPDHSAVRPMPVGSRPFGRRATSIVLKQHACVRWRSERSVVCIRSRIAGRECRWTCSVGKRSEKIPAPKIPGLRRSMKIKKETAEAVLSVHLKRSGIGVNTSFFHCFNGAICPLQKILKLSHCYLVCRDDVFECLFDKAQIV